MKSDVLTIDSSKKPDILKSLVPNGSNMLNPPLKYELFKFKLKSLKKRVSLLYETLEFNFEIEKSPYLKLISFILRLKLFLETSRSSKSILNKSIITLLSSLILKFFNSILLINVFCEGKINESLIFKSLFKFDDPNRYLTFTNPSIKFMFLKL